MFRIRLAVPADLSAILAIYNQGIEDRTATLETDLKDRAYIERWFSDRKPRYSVLVADDDGHTVGWAALNPYSHRCAYDAVADLSIYVRRDRRGTGVGTRLLQALDAAAKRNDFRKIVLFALADNTAGHRLYEKCGYREVGIFREQGVLDGRRIDVLIMERLLV